MSTYRLHIDIPVGQDEEDAIAAAKRIINSISASNRDYNLSIEVLNYRLGHDDDRQKSNYLDKNENGHVNNKKTRLSFTSD